MGPSSSRGLLAIQCGLYVDADPLSVSGPGKMNRSWLSVAVVPHCQSCLKPSLGVIPGVPLEVKPTLSTDISEISKTHTQGTGSVDMFFEDSHDPYGWRMEKVECSLKSLPTCLWPLGFHSEGRL